MVSLNMGMSYPLNQDTIDKVVERGRIGNYAYGYLNEDGLFVVMYVGRSDVDLHDRLGHGIVDFANHPECHYECFKFSYALTIQDAYEKECRNYHDFGGTEGLLVNAVHPAKPEGSCFYCPICGEPLSR